MTEFTELNTEGFSKEQLRAASSFFSDYYVYDSTDSETKRFHEKILDIVGRHVVAEDGPESAEECYARLVEALA